MQLLKRLSAGTNTKRTLYINVARLKMDETNRAHLFHVALPCVHCRKHLEQFAKYRQRKYCQRVVLRYTGDDTGALTTWCKIGDLPPSAVSSGWRLKYRATRGVTANMGKNGNL
jgi:cytidine deaminase